MTDSLLTYSLGCSIVLALLYGVYFLTLKRTTLFSFNRSILLVIMGFSMIAPLLPLSGRVNQAISSTGLTLPEIEITLTAYNSPEAGLTSSADILSLLYLCGMTVTAIWAAANIIFIAYICLTSRKAMIGETGVHVHSHPRLSPFSWGGKIFIPETMLDECDRDIAIMLAHESSHCRRQHWLDLLAANLMVILNWYNPCAWLLLRELIGIHEYEADRDTLSMCDDPAEYQLLLIKKTAGSRFHAFADSLNHSSLKKRITMMMKNQTKSSARLRALAMLPVMAAAMCVSNVSCVSDAADTSAEPEAAVDSTLTWSKCDTYNIGTANFAEFEGGIEKFYQLLAENIHYPEDAMTDSVSGRVIVEITIGTDGEIKTPRVVKGIHPSLDKEAVRAISNIGENGGRFTPARDNDGKAIETTYVLPVAFKLQ